MQLFPAWYQSTEHHKIWVILFDWYFQCFSSNHTKPGKRNMTPVFICRSLPLAVLTTYVCSIWGAGLFSMLRAGCWLMGAFGAKQPDVPFSPTSGHCPICSLLKERPWYMISEMPGDHPQPQIRMLPLRSGKEPWWGRSSRTGSTGLWCIFAQAAIAARGV